MTLLGGADGPVKVLPRSGEPPRQPAQPNPPFVVLYAPPGAGKTTQLGGVCTQGTFVAAPGALAPIRDVYGYDPSKQRLEAQTIADVTTRVAQTAAAGLKSCGIDDASPIMGWTYKVYDDVAPVGRTGRKDTFWGHKNVNNDMLSLYQQARYGGIAVYISCWLTTPKNTDDGFKKGGPKTPANGVTEYLTGMCDLVLRGGTNPAREKHAGHGLVFHTGESYEWTQKSRFPVLPSEIPGNLAEVLRFVGFAIDRHPGLPWQEATVDALALKMWQTGDDHAIVEDAFEKLVAKGVHHLHASWTITDALDRVTLWRTARVGADSVRAKFGWQNKPAVAPAAPSSGPSTPATPTTPK